MQQDRIRRVRERLRDWGLGERVLKTALAAGLAWEVGTHIPGGNARPYFAPLAAILVMQVDVATSVARAVQRIVGVLVGVVVALVLSQVLGVSGWSIALLVLLALAFGTRLRLGAGGVPEVAVSALLVLVIGSSTKLSFALSRILEYIAGAIVGVAVNALLAPPSYLADVSASVCTLGSGLAGVLRELSAGLDEGMAAERAGRCLEQARAVRALLDNAQETLRQANDSLKYNYFGRSQREHLERYRRLIAAFEHTAAQTRAMARTLYDAYSAAPAGQAPREAPLPPQHARALGAVLATVASALERLSTMPPGKNESARSAARDLDAAAAHIHDMRAHLSAEGPANWVAMGALTTLAGRMVADLASMVDHLSAPGDGVPDAD